MENGINNKSRVYSEEYKSEIVDRFLSSGLKQQEFSEKEGISRSALYSWVKKRGGASSKASVGKFIDVPLKKPERESQIELELPQGIILRIWR